MRKSAILTLLWLMASVPIAGAGPAPTVLSGTVLNSRGVPVAGARVFWQASDGRAPHALHTDANGKFRVDPLREGWYDLRAEAAGSWSEWEHNVIVRHGQQADVKLRLVRGTPPKHSSSAGTAKVTPLEASPPKAVLQPGYRSQ